MKFSLFSYAFLTTGSILLFGCCPSKLEQALILAGDNRSELEQALQHYSSNAEPYAAARFLIENMTDKTSITYQAIDSQGRQVCIDTLSPNYLQKTLEGLTFLREPPRLDLECISAKFLIKHIDLAFEARRRYPWCAALSFEEFCRSVLPYRIKYEPLENWRSYYLDRYGVLADSLAQAGCSLSEVVFFLNERLGKRYIQVADRLRGDRSFREIEHIGGGTCDDLALNAVQLMRALGIPLQLDFLPYHGRVNGGHVYNSFRDEKGAFYFFSPYERAPERNQWIAPLVLRWCYEIQPDRGFSKNQWNGILCSDRVRNVTADYYPVSRVEVSVNAPVCTWVALATYNRGRFCPVAQSVATKRGTAEFDSIARSLLYFVVQDTPQGMGSVGFPFVLTEQGAMNTIRLTDTAITVNGVHLYDVKRIAPLGTTSYELRVWKDRWIPVAHTSASDSNTLNFGVVGVHSVFLVWGETPLGRTQRPFVIRNGEQIFY